VRLPLALHTHKGRHMDEQWRIALETWLKILKEFGNN
jgi:hypothetical protein